MRANRREFLASSSTLAASFVASAGTASLGLSAITMPARSYARIVGSNDALRGATIGLNNRGKDHIAGLNSHLIALCDCDQKVMEQVAGEFEKKYEKKIDRVQDYRELLQRDDIDFVSIATPNHTHALIAISAILAGKHVYCEKPVSHNLWEGRQIVNAARQESKMVQCGTQSRSSAGLKAALEFARSGKLGRALYAVGTCYKPRKSIGKLDQPLQIPAHIDYDLWCGPAEKKSLLRPQLHYDWHWDFNTGNGDMGNQGIHQMDIARWFLGHQTISPRVLSVGGRLGYSDAGNTPNTQTVIHDYPTAPIIFETRGLPQGKEYQDNRWGGSMDNYLGSQIGVIVFYENGKIVIPSYTQATAFDLDGNQVQAWQAGGNHFQNFIDAVTQQDRTLLNAEIEEGHLSSALCHTGGLSHQLGEAVSREEILAKVAGDERFADSVNRMLDHVDANAVDLQETPLIMGADLEFDPQAETAIGNELAGQGLSREYRVGFEVLDMTAVTK